MVRNRSIAIWVIRPKTCSQRTRNRLQLPAEQLPVDRGIELVDALDGLQHRLLVLDHAEQITLFLRVAVSHARKILYWQTL